jgi:hypothetical protein
MAKTLAEILKETGLSDEQISAIDQKAMDGLTRIVTSANDTLERAEFARRAQHEEYDKNIAPSLAKWADNDAILSTENAALKTWAQKVKDSGYLPAEVVAAMPTFGAVSANPQATSTVRGPDGKFVAGANPTPGSPAFVDTKKLEQDLAGAFSFTADTSWNYRRLYGQEMPDSPTALIREAAQQRMSPQDWAAKKYDFAGKEKTAAEAKQKEHDDAIRKAAVEETEKKWAERVGNNPNIRIPQESAFTEVQKAVTAGKRQDPLKMTPEQRKTNTHANIQQEMQERSSRVQ